MAKRKGRPSKFSQSLAAKILALTASGKTDKEVAEECGIALSTLKNWRGDKADFSAAVRAAKNVADEMVEASLFARAVGYSHPAVKFFFHAESGSVVTEEYVEHYPPDTGACTFWLKNRQKKRWRDRQEHTGKDGEPIKTDGTIRVIVEEYKE